MERALAQLNRRVEIRGFRRGKAPKTLLERYVGKDAIYEEAASGGRGTATLASGAAVTYEVVDVKRRRLPDLTDEFARTAAGVETVPVLRETLRERAQREAQQRAEQEDEQKAVESTAFCSS